MHIVLVTHHMAFRAQKLLFSVPLGVVNKHRHNYSSLSVLWIAMFLGKMPGQVVFVILPLNILMLEELSSFKYSARL